MRRIIKKLFHKHQFEFLEKSFIKEGSDWGGWTGNEPNFVPTSYKEYQIKERCCNCGEYKITKLRELL